MGTSPATSQEQQGWRRVGVRVGSRTTWGVGQGTEQRLGKHAWANPGAAQGSRAQQRAVQGAIGPGAGAPAPCLQGCRGPPPLARCDSKGSWVLSTERYSGYLLFTEHGNVLLTLRPSGWLRPSQALQAFSSSLGRGTFRPRGPGFLHPGAQDSKSRAVVHKEPSVSIVLIYQVGCKQDNLVAIFQNKVHE